MSFGNFQNLLFLSNFLSKCDIAVICVSAVTDQSKTFSVKKQHLIGITFKVS